MTTFKKSVLTLATLTTIVSVANARDQIRIVGSSTVYPFSSAVAETLGATTAFKTPVVESTGSGGGMKLFCKGNDLNTPDFTNASRRMKAKEFKMCQKNGVKHITEAVIGYDGIAIAQNSKNPAISLTKQQLLLAVAAEVPSKDGKTLIANPYVKWSDIDASLPNRKITFYGPPTSSGTRDAFEDMIMKAQTKKMDAYTALYKSDKVKYKAYKKYHKIRQDGVYVPSGENDNLIVQKLSKNPAAFGIFGYSFLEENRKKVQAAKIKDIEPTPETIGSGEYPLSRSLYFYIKKDHEAQISGMKEYVALFMADKTIADDGEMTDIGLIPLPETELKAIQASVKKRKELTKADFSK